MIENYSQTHVHPERSHRVWLWPMIVIGMLSAQLLVCGLTLFLALSDATFAVEPSYYAEATRWSQHAARTQNAKDLGWAVDLTVGNSLADSDTRPLAIALRDRDGTPLSAATVTCVVFHHAHGGDRATLTLRETDPGVYATMARLPWSGTWEFRLAATHAGQTLSATERREISAAGESR